MNAPRAEVAARRPIRVLDPAVADAIAAGEVVERPASVIKELIENAVDAGATELEIDCDGGGLVRLCVADDGAGIAAADLALAVARHATSKVEQLNDLEAIHTLGFRGEALASIAAVSELVITSRRVGDDVASRLRVRAGAVAPVERASRAVGTTVEVCDLFHNTPARLRFLRAERTESAAVQRAVTDAVLAHPQLRVRLRSGGREVVRSSGAGFEEALQVVFGSAAAELLTVSGGDDTVQVRGAISQPRSHRASRAQLLVIVNGRRVHNPRLLIAVEEAYRGLLPLQRHPFGAVMLEIDSALVDVNVHPTKREVRIADEGAVFSAVQRACWHALQERASLYTAPALWEAPASPRSEPVMTGATVVPLGFEDSVDEPAPAPPDGERDSLSALAPLRALGQAGDGWMAAVSDSSGAVVLVDPHAAHEKVIYAALRRRLEMAASDERQLLLLPATLECSAAEMAAVAANAELIERLGFEIDEFGPATLRCTAVPAAAAEADLERLLRDLLALLLDRDSVAQRQHSIAALVACHSSVRFGDALSLAEQQRLLDQLASTAGGMTCPHGRPTAMVLDDATLRRAFRRPPR